MKYEVWRLVIGLENHSIIGTKWVYRNKLGENGIILRNEARFVVQGYNKMNELILKKPLHP